MRNVLPVPVAGADDDIFKLIEVLPDFEKYVSNGLGLYKIFPSLFFCNQWDPALGTTGKYRWKVGDPGGRCEDKKNY